jgi:hypothetical protein
MVLAIGLFPLVAFGCDSGVGARARVKGKVTFSNRPVTAGTIGFFGPKNRTASTQILEDGTYDIADAPVGDVTITVETPGATNMMGGRFGQPERPPGVGSMPADKAPPNAGLITSPNKIVPIPAKYSKVETSGLKFTVENGTNDHDITLTP